MVFKYGRYSHRKYYVSTTFDSITDHKETKEEERALLHEWSLERTNKLIGYDKRMDWSHYAGPITTALDKAKWRVLSVAASVLFSSSVDKASSLYSGTNLTITMLNELIGNTPR